MIVGGALCGIVWLVAGAAGWPVDPFAPLAVAVALRPDWSRGRRLVVAGALGPIAAALLGGDAIAHTGAYAGAVLVASEVGGGMRDGVLARIAVAAGVGLALLGLTEGMALASGGAARGALLPAAIGTTAWTAAHALLTVRRGEPR